MKKIISLTIVAIMLMTSVSFAQPNNDTITSLKELTEINNDIGIVIRNILTCGYDVNSENQTLTYNRGIVKQVLGRSYSNYNQYGSDLIENREATSLIYIASLYALSINGLSIYLEDTEKNEKYLFDAITQYRDANIALLEFKTSIKE